MVKYNGDYVLTISHSQPHHEVSQILRNSKYNMDRQTYKYQAKFSTFKENLLPLQYCAG